MATPMKPPPSFLSKVAGKTPKNMTNGNLPAAVGKPVTNHGAMAFKKGGKTSAYKKGGKVKRG